MRNLFFLFLSIFISPDLFGQTEMNEKDSDKAFYEATNNWFAAWKLVSKDIYKVDRVRPVEFVFFDDQYVYSTSSTTIKNGKYVRGCNLLNLTLGWKKELHHDRIILPDGSKISIRLMSFAAEIPHKNGRSFFVMPLPAYWAKSGITSKELGLKNLITGVFIHEFSHSQQMQNFGIKMTQFEKQHNYGVEFSDDIVQNLFQEDSSYLSIYNQEVSYFYQSTQNQSLDKASVKNGFNLMAQRQGRYFKDKYLSLKEIDHFFLTMEGLGQYSMYLWLIHPKGGNIKKETAIEGVRRTKKWWSQDEGFALFLILDKSANTSTWAKDMFGNKTESVIDLIAKKLL